MSTNSSVNIKDLMADSYVKRIAKIQQVQLGYEDHGIFTLVLMVDYGGSGQGVGGHALSVYDKATKKQTGTRYGMEWIIRVMRACGVSDWSKVQGRTVHVLFAHDDWNAKPLGIEPLPTEEGERFIFADLKGLADA